MFLLFEGKAVKVQTSPGGVAQNFSVLERRDLLEETGVLHKLTREIVGRMKRPVWEEITRVSSVG